MYLPERGRNLALHPPCITESTRRVRTGHGKPGKSWNLIISLSRPGKSWNLGLGHGKSWKISTLSMSERQ